MNNIFTLILLLMASSSLASEFDSRQAFILVDADPGFTIKFSPENNEVPSFSIESDSKHILIPVSSGKYTVAGIQIELEAHKINLVTLSMLEGEWAKIASSKEKALEFLEENYPILKLEIVTP